MARWQAGEWSSGAYTLSAATTPVFFLAILGVAMRLHVRVFMLHCAGLDDYVALLALLLIAVAYFANLAASVSGFGHPYEGLDPDQVVIILKSLWISPAAWGLSSALVKMSIVWSYLRIWSTPKTARALHGLLVFLGLFGLTAGFGELFKCIPVTSNWDLSLQQGGGHGHRTDNNNNKEPPPPPKCLNHAEFSIFVAVLNISLDLVVFLLPIPLIRRLQVPKKTKWGLVGVFSIGLVVCVASVMRFIALLQFLHAKEKSGGGIGIAIWSGVENNLMLFACCLPALRPLLSKAFPKLFQSTTQGGGSKSFGNGSSSAKRAVVHYSRPRRPTFDNDVSYDFMPAAARYRPVQEEGEEDEIANTPIGRKGGAGGLGGGDEEQGYMLKDRRVVGGVDAADLEEGGGGTPSPIAVPPKAYR